MHRSRWVKRTNNEDMRQRTDFGLAGDNGCIRGNYGEGTSEGNDSDCGLHFHDLSYLGHCI